MTTKANLHKDEFVPYAPDEPGVIHRHHCKQGHGNDRLYITRKDDDTILAYCHHCGASGSHSVLGTRVIKAADKSNETTGTDSEHSYVPNGPAEFNVENWPKHVQRWWFEYGLTVRQAAQAAAVYFEDDDTLGYLHLGGAQYRHFSQSSKLKYRSKPDIPDLNTSLFHNDNWGSVYDILVTNPGGAYPFILVEDFRSAMKMSNFGYALALGGTNPSSELLAGICEIRNTHLINNPIIVWFDNDNAQVCDASRNLTKRLQGFGLKASRISESVIADKDPKELGWETIRHILAVELK